MDTTTEVIAEVPTRLELGGFLRAAAHEIANQVNAISMSGELIKMLLQRGDDKRALETLERLLSDCGRCGRMVRGMERFGSALKAQPHEGISLDALVQGGAAMYLQERSVGKPALHVEASCTTVLADQVGLQRAVAALLHNATEAGAQRIDVRARRDDEGICIEIADDGDGMTSKVRERATEPFFTTRRAQGHNGLGLTLVCEVLRTHGGDLSIDDNEPSGTRITLRLPAGR